MLNDIKPFLPLYTGNYVRVTTKDARFDALMVGVFFDRWHRQHEITIQIQIGDWYTYYQLEQIQLLLRPLSDMTEEEAVDLLTAQFPEKRIIDVVWERYGIGYRVHKVKNYTLYWEDMKSMKAEAFRYLLSKGFDLFGLIEAGLAIDKTKEVCHA